MNSSLLGVGLMAHQRFLFWQWTVANTDIQNWSKHRDQVAIERFSQPVSLKAQKTHERESRKLVRANTHVMKF